MRVLKNSFRWKCHIQKVHHDKKKMPQRSRRGGEKKTGKKGGGGARLRTKELHKEKK